MSLDNKYLYIKYKMKYLNLKNQLGGDQNNYDYVLAKVSINGLELANASDELKSNRTIIEAAITNDGEALEFVPEDLKRDKNLYYQQQEVIQIQCFIFLICKI